MLSFFLYLKFLDQVFWRYGLRTKFVIKVSIFGFIENLLHQLSTHFNSLISLLLSLPSSPAPPHPPPLSAVFGQIGSVSPDCAGSHLVDLRNCFECVQVDWHSHSVTVNLIKILVYCFTDISWDWWNEIKENEMKWSDKIVWGNMI